MLAFFTWLKSLFATAPAPTQTAPRPGGGYQPVGAPATHPSPPNQDTSADGGGRGVPERPIPKWIGIALSLSKLSEGIGAADNPAVVQLYADAGHHEVKHDSVAWCAAFVGACLRRAGLSSSGSLLARSYLKWGVDSGGPRFGAVAVKPRLVNGVDDGVHGHVFFVVAANDTHVYGLGGNQKDSVRVEKFLRSSVLAYRLPFGVDSSSLPDLPAGWPGV